MTTANDTNTKTAAQLHATMRTRRVCMDGRGCVRIICGRCRTLSCKHFITGYAGRFDLRTGARVATFDRNAYAIHLGTCGSCVRRSGGWRQEDFWRSRYAANEDEATAMLAAGTD